MLSCSRRHGKHCKNAHSVNENMQHTLAFYAKDRVKDG